MITLHAHLKKCRLEISVEELHVADGLMLDNYRRKNTVEVEDLCQKIIVKKLPFMHH
jgi:hypothetical protein